MRIVKLVRYRLEIPTEPRTAVGEINENTYKFYTDRYVVLRNFIPKEIIEYSMDVWRTIESQPELNVVCFDKEIAPIPDTPKSMHEKSFGGYSTPMGVALHRYIHKKLSTELDLNLIHTYSYTRKYERGSYLKAHADRPSCEISATLCLDYSTDDNEPWTIWLDNSRNWVDDGQGDQEALFRETQGIPIRKRKSIPVKLNVGDIMIYQGPNVVHWRDNLLGNHSYHMFVHFVNKETRMANINNELFKDTQEYTQSGTRYVLTYDGRDNPYSQKQEGHPFEKRFKEWMDIYDHKIMNKSDFVNYYEDYEFTPIEE